MAKITRAYQKIFGGTGTTSDFGEFGSLAAGTPTTTKDPATIQSLGAWLGGWAEATIGILIPAYQDMNSVHYLAFYQICYILQMGISEYDASTSYYIGSFVQYNTLTYQSLVDDNVGNQPNTSAADWKCVSAFGFGANVASASSMTLGNDGNSFKVTGTTTINNITIKPSGIIVNLAFTGVLTVNTGGNILLNNGAFLTAANSTLVLMSDGTNWFELSRSPQVSALGAWTSQTIGTIYQAPSDGTVEAFIEVTTASLFFLSLFTDSSSSPSTRRSYNAVAFPTGNGEGAVSVISKVKSGDYYQVVRTNDGVLSTSGMWFIADAK